MLIANLPQLSAQLTLAESAQTPILRSLMDRLIRRPTKPADEQSILVPAIQDDIDPDNKIFITKVYKSELHPDACINFDFEVRRPNGSVAGKYIGTLMRYSAMPVRFYCIPQ